MVLLQHKLGLAGLKPRSGSSCSSLVVKRPNFAVGHLANARCVTTRAQQDDKDKAELESAFAKELKRRGIDSANGSVDSPKSEPASPNSKDASSTARDPFASSTKTRARAPPPPKVESFQEDQRQKSIDMVNEGLEGLIPRASQLIRLGASVFLAFLPFILAISLLFGAVYMTFGDNFVHRGRPGSGPPPYVDPQELLSESTVDPYVPF